MTLLRRLLARREISSSRFIVLLALFLIAFANKSFFANVLAAYPLGMDNAVFLLSVAWVAVAITVLVLALFCVPYVTKPLAVVVVIVSSLTAYFMDTYNTLVDHSMMRNVVRTDTDEVLDLLSLRLALYLVFLGIVPAVLICRAKLVYQPPLRELLVRGKLVFFSLAAVALAVLPMSGHYSTFLRENKPLRYYSNPGCIVYATCKLAGSMMRPATIPFRQVGLDARLREPGAPRKLVLFVVGESARADRFSLNGYERATNPRLAQKPVLSFTDFWSYGTSTAISVPYMFSVIDRSDFDLDAAPMTENLLDILQRVGTHVLWLDNNSSSKGVADRVPYENYKHAARNPICDTECRDEGMLRNLQPYIDARAEGDIFIVLHKMGAHGPAYYKRYPPEFERFTPVARTNQLQDCTDEEIGNAYDNVMLYTDHVLAEAIEFLEGNDDDFDVAMLYVSDHGESLGENGVYLHGMPNFIAPDAQRHVPAVFWIGDGFDAVDMDALAAKRDETLSHDVVAQSLLGLMGIETDVYNRKLDIFRAPK